MFADLETILTESGVSVANIFTPRDAGKWRVTLRQGPAWVVGEPCDTLSAALDSALTAFRREWLSKTGGNQVSAPAVDDDLERLLG